MPAEDFLNSSGGEAAVLPVRRDARWDGCNSAFRAELVPYDVYLGWGWVVLWGLAGSVRLVFNLAWGSTGLSVAQGGERGCLCLCLFMTALIKKRFDKTEWKSEEM